MTLFTLIERIDPDPVTTISDISQYRSTVKTGKQMTTLTDDSRLLSTKMTQLLSTKMTRMSQNQYSRSTTVSSSILTSRSNSITESEHFQPSKTSTDESVVEKGKSSVAIQNEHLPSTSDPSILISSSSIRVTADEHSQTEVHLSSPQMIRASESKDHENHTMSETSTGKAFTYLNSSLPVKAETHFGRTSQEVLGSPGSQFIGTEGFELTTEKMTSIIGFKRTRFETTTRSEKDEDANRCSISPCKNGGTCEAKGRGYSCVCTPHFQGTRCELGSYVSIYKDFVVNE